MGERDRVGLGILTDVVEVHVDAAVVQEQEVPDRIDSLYFVPVAVVGAQEPSVFFFNEIARRLFGPDLQRERSGQWVVQCGMRNGTDEGAP